MSTFQQSAACCKVPPIDPNEVKYTPRGTYEDAAGLITYVTGDRNAKACLIILYDIFAFHPNTLRGADILGSEYLVLMPDFFEGKAADWSWYPDDTPEKTEKLEGFLNGPGNTEKTVEKVTRVQANAQTRFASVEKWGIAGYCWGGWVSSYASIYPTPFSAIAQLHPGFAPQKIASQIRIPLLAICSKDETDGEAQTFMTHLSPEIAYKHYIRFGDMEHGWLSARGDLKNDDVKKAYEKGYALLLDFFAKYL
ncbi:hypothetical protein N0V90_002159 [Kalmusia sp. IMI 367209]|nr:hypothetical protein N0V90_002159 [Kalmusia sp. IMI 367209]